MKTQKFIDAVPTVSEGGRLKEIKTKNQKIKIMATKKSKYRIGELVSVPHDNNKHKVKSKRQDRFGNWHYYVTNISGEFPESWLEKPKRKKSCRKK